MANGINLRGFTFFLFLLGMPLLLAGQTYPGQIGVGVGLNQWNKPFVNIIHNARAFEALDGGEVEMDDKGWPLSDARLVLLEAWPVAEWWNETDDPESYHTDLSGTYTCSFKGIANVSKASGDFILGRGFL